MPSRRKAKRRKRKKSTYTILAPESLGGMPLHQVWSSDDKSLIGRIYKPLLYDLTEDLQHQNIILNLKIHKVVDGEAHSVYAGHRYVREYLRSLIMRGTTLVEGTTGVTTKDMFKYRLAAVAFTIRRINKSRMKAIRKIMHEKIRRKGEDLASDAFIKEILFEKVAAEIYGSSRKICPLRHVGIMKVKLLEAPRVVEEITVESANPSGGEG